MSVFRGCYASDKPRCDSCGAFIDATQRHQACPNPKCGKAIFVIDGQIVQRPPRPGTEVYPS